MTNYLSREEEAWKDIPNFEGLYEASTFGRIRTKEGKQTFTTLRGVRTWKQRIMKQKIDKTDSYRICLWKDGKSYDFLSARIIATTFLDNLVDTDMTVNHKDGNRKNNNIENLEWCSRKDNIIHSFDNIMHKRQIPVVLIASESNIEYKFRSLAMASKFCGRSHNFVKDCLLENKLLHSTDGLQYLVVKG